MHGLHTQTVVYTDQLKWKWKDLNCHYLQLLLWNIPGLVKFSGTNNWETDLNAVMSYASSNNVKLYITLKRIKFIRILRLISTGLTPKMDSSEHRDSLENV